MRLVRCFGAVISLGLLLSLAGNAAGQDAVGVAAAGAAWERGMEARAAAVYREYGKGSDPALAGELQAMRDEDQDVRQRLFMNQDVNSLSEERRKALTAELNATDARLTARLKRIVAAKGWPTIPLVGLDGSKAAALMLVHTPDHAWQKAMLPELERLVETGAIWGDDLAGVIDTELKAEGKLQRFGTRFDFKQGVMIMTPVEDPANLDALRAKYLLPPMGYYRQMMEQMYHMKVQ